MARWRQICQVGGLALFVAGLTTLLVDTNTLAVIVTILGGSMLAGSFLRWPSPDLVIGKPTVSRFQGVDVVRVRVENASLSHEDQAVARSIRAIIQFEGATVSLRIEGKWADEWDTVRVGRLEAIPPGDDGYGLDVAFKWPGEKECYALNGKNFATGVDGWRLYEHRLPDESYSVIIELTGKGFKKQTQTFTLTNGDSISLGASAGEEGSSS